MKRPGMKAAVTAVFCLVLFLGSAGASEPKAPRISKEQLKSILGDPNVVILDVRIGRDWSESSSKIKGAVREDPTRFDSWYRKYPKDKTIVLYCS